MDTITVNPANLWRLETPGHAGWERTARPGDSRKHFIVSADEHVNEPATLWLERIDEPDRKSTRLNSSHIQKSRMPSSA